MKLHPCCLLVAGSALLVLTGCHSIGPSTIVTDRADYSSSIAESWKRQTLLNVVKLRYLDLPVFVDVSSVVAGYSLQASLAAGGTIAAPSTVQGNSLTATGQAIYTDRPTVTYTPLTGENFLRSLITPIQPKNIFSLLQSGYAADAILAITVESFNGLRNRSSAAGSLREADPDFIRALVLMREIQEVGAVGMRVEVDNAKDETTVMFFRQENVSSNILADIIELRRLLKLPDGAQRFTVVYSPVRGASNELTVGSRSLIQIMSAFASYVDVPEQDIKEQRAIPSAGDSDAAHRPVSIKCSKDKPDDAYAAVYYRHHWFWVDDRDWRSKRAFTSIMFLFTMIESGGDNRAPVLTIPAQ